MYLKLGLNLISNPIMNSIYTEDSLMNDIRIAAVVFNSRTGRIQDNLDRMVKWIKLAHKEDVRLICFPEMNISGYGHDESILEYAEPIPGVITETLTRIASFHNMVILAGIAEKNEQGQLYASHLVISPDGGIGVYRKLHLAPPELDCFTQGHQIPIFESFGVKYGIQLCYDAHFPELSMYMALKEVDVIFFPHASPRGNALEKHTSWMRHLPARAYDNGIFVVACNQTGKNGDGLSFPGNAVVLDPSGKIMKKELSGDEKLMVVDLKKEQLDFVRNHRMRYFSPHRRLDIYDF